MLILIGLILLVGGFALGYLTCAIYGMNKKETEPEEEWTPGIIPRADCMPPGCNDYPECNHRY